MSNQIRLYKSMDELIQANTESWIKNNLGVSLFDYQLKFLKLKSRINVLRAGRRTGKTTACMTAALFFAATKPNTNVTMYTRNLPLCINQAYAAVKIDHQQLCIKSVSYQQRVTHYEFKNSSTITFIKYGANPEYDNMSKDDYLLLDEIDDVDESVFNKIKWYQYKKMFIATTPSSRGNLSNMYKNPDIEEIHVPMSMSPLYNEYDAQRLNLTLDKNKFKTEVLAEFV
jgi:hypothetical protein